MSCTIPHTFPLKLGKAPKKRFHTQDPLQLVNYKGGKPLIFMPECYTSDDLLAVIKLLNAANATNMKLLETKPFSRPVTEAKASPTPSHPEPHPALVVITHEEVLKRSRCELQRAYQNANVVIKGCHVPEGEQEWNEDNLSTIGDMDKMRDIHGE
ncbi:hypothetical protein V5O48_016300 [Marasmius crinis-equi]|uniref:Uncharacterized protein n=1 Tax=Marasmius crinis-equi TaxID=585013 RepID=A0ABR3ES59_9AGAR